MMEQEELIDKVKSYRSIINGFYKRIDDVKQQRRNGFMPKKNAQNVIQGLEAEITECSIQLDAMEYVLLSKGEDFPKVRMAVKTSNAMRIFQNPKKLMHRRMKKILEDNGYERVGENIVDIKAKENQTDYRFGNSVKEYDEHINLFSITDDGKEELVDELYR